MIDLPNWIDKSTWEDWEQMRTKMRKPLTDAARRLAVKRLLRLYEVDPINNHPQEVMEQSILCGYQGFWPVNTGRAERRDGELQRELRAGTGPQVRKR